MSSKLDKEISIWLKEYLENSRLSCFVIGISGGIDSALTSILCAQTGIKTVVVSMPIYQAQDQLQRAHNHIKWLCEKYPNIEYCEYDLTPTFDTFKSLFENGPENKNENNLASANSRSRLRMMTLYHIAGIHRGLVVGTGNKIEDFGVGFFTKYGDGGVDISPIADLTKTEVRQLAKELGVTDEIIAAKPTDGLWDDDRTDEDQLGASYEELEWAMDFAGNPQELSGREREVYDIYTKFNTQNKHKMVPIPTFRKNSSHIAACFAPLHTIIQTHS